MKKVLLVAPSDLAVSLPAAKSNLRIDGDHLDDVVTLWIEGIVSALEHEVGQCLMRQTWRVLLDTFPPAGVQTSADVCTTSIKLPHPVIKVKSVSYLDAAGERQTMPDDAYEVSASELSSALVLSPGASWPAVTPRLDAVRIEVECGYGVLPEKTPACMRLYILAKLVEQFDPSSKPDKNSVQSVYLERLLDNCRTYQ